MTYYDDDDDGSNQINFYCNARELIKKDGINFFKFNKLMIHI